MENYLHDKLEKYVLVHRTRMFTASFFIVLTFIVASIAVIYVLNKTYDQHIILQRETTRVSLIEQHIHNIFRQATSDLQVLKSHYELGKLLESQEKLDVENLAKEYAAMSSSKDIYDQIRYIDNTGNEIIKVIYNNDRPKIIEESELENKGDRYYFTNTIGLQKGETFMSPFNLNVENGAIEKPNKPVVRIASPIFDNDENNRGIVILNFNGKYLLDDIEQFKLQDENQLMLLNKESYWLKGSVPEDEWGFMNEETKDVNFKNRYPEVWTEINNKVVGQIYSKEGVFTFNTIFPLEFGQISSNGIISPTDSNYSKVGQDQYYWKIVSFVSYDEMEKDAKMLLYYLVTLGGILLLVMAYRTFMMYKILSTVHLERHDNI